MIAAWKAGQVEEKLSAKAAEVSDRLSKGEDIAKVATDLGVQPKTAEKLTRGTQPAGDLSAATIQAAFAGPKGYSGVAPGSADKSQIVILVTDVNLPPYFSGAPDLAEGKDQLSRQLSNDLLQQYVGQVQSSLGTRVNQAALQQALGVPGS